MKQDSFVPSLFAVTIEDVAELGNALRKAVMLMETIHKGTRPDALIIEQYEAELAARQAFPVWAEVAVITRDRRAQELLTTRQRLLRRVA